MPPPQLATRLGYEAEERHRARRTTQRGMPAQNQEPKTPFTPTTPKFLLGKTRLAKGVMNRAAAVAARNLNVMEAIARETKSQGDQVARHPRLLNRGEPIGRRRYDLDQETHPETSTSGSHHSNQEENKPTLRKQDHASRDLGSRKRKTERLPI